MGEKIRSITWSRLRTKNIRNVVFKNVLQSLPLILCKDILYPKLNKNAKSQSNDLYKLFKVIKAVSIKIDDSSSFS